MKSYAVHYKNKYPAAKVAFTETSLDVTSADGELLVALRIGGGGALLDKGEELGARDRHDLAPIPKNARVHKLFACGKIGKDEHAEAREKCSKAMAVDGKVWSIEEYKAKKIKFDGDSIVFGDSEQETHVL